MSAMMGVIADCGFAICGFAICNLRFAVCNLRFAVCHLQFAICYLPFAVCSLQADDLPAQLRTDGAARARDEHALAPQHAAHRADVGAHRLAAQQILDPHVAHLLDADAAVQ